MKLSIFTNSDIDLDANDAEFIEYLPILSKKSLILDECKNNRELLILRGHIAIEYFLEDIIKKYLPNSEKIIEQNLSFARKAAIVESFNVLEIDVMALIKKFNALRNRCAHKLEFRITDNDIENLGSCIPDVYEKLKGGENILLDIITSVLINMVYSSYLLVKNKE